MEVTCYIGLGSNLGDSIHALREAAEKIAQLDNTRIMHASSIYQTAPMGPGEQASYYNAVVAVNTTLSADELLTRLQRIENDMGRERVAERWLSRIIDLDILLYGSCKIESEHLIVPHPGLHERAFVLYPLHELDANLSIPGKGKITEFMQAPLHGEIEKRLEILLWP